TVSAGSITTTNANDLVLFAVSAQTPTSYSGAPTPGTWTSLPGLATQTITQAEWYRVVSATGVFAPQVTQTGAFWEAALVAFRLAQ
ncbi:MAG TPA: hypothetical protein VIV11_18535, partial [Kofleriaceae bacterium]